MAPGPLFCKRAPRGRKFFIAQRDVGAQRPGQRPKPRFRLHDDSLSTPADHRLGRSVNAKFPKHGFRNRQLSLSCNSGQLLHYFLKPHYSTTSIAGLLTLSNVLDINVSVSPPPRLVAAHITRYLLIGARYISDRNTLIAVAKRHR